MLSDMWKREGGADMTGSASRFIQTAGMVTLLATGAAAQTAEPHGWLGSETLKSRWGDFEFKNGYPAGDSGERLLDLMIFNRAVEVYLTQLMAVSEIALRE